MQNIYDYAYSIPQDVFYTERKDALYLAKMTDDDNVFKLSGLLSALYLSLDSKESLIHKFEEILKRDATLDELAQITLFAKQMLKLDLIER